LQYLPHTCPNIAHAVQQACLYMHAPRDSHLNLMKRILRYIKGTLDLGMHFSSSPATSLTVYSDVDWAGCPNTCRSTSVYYIYLSDNLISWSSKWQATVSRSSAEAEYRAVAYAVAECAGFVSFLASFITPLFCDSGLLRQCEHGLHGFEPSATSSYQAHRDRHSFCSRKGVAW
jgi:hypothetical protein